MRASAHSSCCRRQEMMRRILLWQIVGLSVWAVRDAACAPLELVLIVRCSRKVPTTHRSYTREK